MGRNLAPLLVASTFLLAVHANADPRGLDQHDPAVAACHGEAGPGWQVLDPCTADNKTCVAFYGPAAKAFAVQCKAILAEPASAPSVLPANWRQHVRGEGQKLCLGDPVASKGWERVAIASTDDRRDSTMHYGASCAGSKADAALDYCIASYLFSGRLFGFVEVDCRTQVAEVTYLVAGPKKVEGPKKN